MKKEVIKESKKCYLIVDIIFYLLICVLGLIVLTLNGIEAVSILKYLYLIFYSLGFLSLIAYFINRRENDFEFLYFGLINIYVGTFTLVYRNYSNAHFILGNSVLIYTIANALNKGLHVKILDQNRSLNVISKLSIMLVLMIFSLLISINFYDDFILESEILGYYFLNYGLLSLMEPLINVLIKNKRISKYFNVGIEREETKTEKKIKTNKKVNKREVKKPKKSNKVNSNEK